MASRIQSLELARYRGFRDSGRLALSRLSLLYGENNSGKSALIRIAPLLAGSYTRGRPGLNLDGPALRGAGFREVQWRGSLPTEEDPDLILGLGLTDGATWRWTFRWLDLRSIAVIQRIEIEIEIDAQGQKAEFQLIDRAGQQPKDADYSGPEGPIQLLCDGLIPGAGTGTLIDQHRDALITALNGVIWLGAIRQGPTRAGTARGARGSLMGEGEGASALVLADPALRQAVSPWFAAHAHSTVEVEALGAEMQRLVLQPFGARYAVPFPDAGEGLQQAFPLVVALERLRREGGLLAIEEPESHLHPRLQRALAELIIDVLTAQPSASVMLETHSEIFLVAALSAAAGALPGAVRLHWVAAGEDGAAAIEEVPLDSEGRPTTLRLEQAFETMGVMRRELLQERRATAGQRRPHGG